MAEHKELWKDDAFWDGQHIPTSSRNDDADERQKEEEEEDASKSAHLSYEVMSTYAEHCECLNKI